MAPSPEALWGASLAAILGPTNTGKTHRAVERMLAHRTGMIGLPLRLLAREVYERVSLRVGEQAVALVTGEEKRIPATPRYWVCTVESMPLERPVAFLCVDEVQLSASRERGHVFTDRLLNTRGVLETLFLGASTVTPLLQRMLPGIRIGRHPRFSTLRHEGRFRIRTLPPRTALIAFSAAQVYELAERVRECHGGAAIVLGALSPRTRNAQVALYQSGEVRHIVATDAIGMGLNLDLDRVVFSGLQKFDGHIHRPLDASELAQIAGRAGRYRNDGAFGTLKGCEDLDPRTARAIESHELPTLRSLWYRNSDLDFSSVEALRSSLLRPPPFDFLRPVDDAEDADALRRLLEIPGIAGRSLHAGSLRLLWDVARIPDFQGLRDDRRIQLQARIFLTLLEAPHRLGDDFMMRHLGALETVVAQGARALGAPASAIDALTTRIADIRLWNYVAHHPAWLEHPHEWQARTQHVEDRLSDMLHDLLTERFVDRVSVALRRGRREASEELRADSEGGIWSDGRLVGRLDGFSGFLGWTGPIPGSLAERVRPLLEARVQDLVDSPFEDFILGDDGSILWRGVQVARLEAGRNPIEPILRTARTCLLGAGARSRLHRRLEAWVQDHRAWILEPLDLQGTEGASPALKGLLFRLREKLGVVSTAETRELLRVRTPADRALLTRLDIATGHHATFSRPMLEQGRARARAILWCVYLSIQGPSHTACRLERVQDVRQERCLVELGYRVVGGIALRVDLFEEISAVLRSHAPRLPETRSLLHMLCAARETVQDEAFDSEGILASLLRDLGWTLTDDATWVLSRRPRLGA